MTDKEREAQCLFKAWAQDHLDLDYEIAPEEWGNDGAFKWTETGNFFRCWQAARAPLLARLEEAYLKIEALKEEIDSIMENGSGS